LRGAVARNGRDVRRGNPTYKSMVGAQRAPNWCFENRYSGKQTDSGGGNWTTIFAAKRRRVASVQSSA